MRPGAQATKEHSCPEDPKLMEAVVGRKNIWRALRRVEANKGAPGVDDMPVTELRRHLKERWPRIREDLLEGRYQPAPVRRVEIPRPGGGIRELGIPTVLDRLNQQAIHQVPGPIFEPGFPESVRRLKGKIRLLCRLGKGRNLGRFITDDLMPPLRGWINYFKLAETKGMFGELDRWIRRRLRVILWRQWKRTYTRARNLMRRGLDEERASAQPPTGAAPGGTLVPRT